MKIPHLHEAVGEAIFKKVVEDLAVMAFGFFCGRGFPVTALSGRDHRFKQGRRNFFQIRAKKSPFLLPTPTEIHAGGRSDELGRKKRTQRLEFGGHPAWVIALLDVQVVGREGVGDGNSLRLHEWWRARKCHGNHRQSLKNVGGEFDAKQPLIGEGEKMFDLLFEERSPGRVLCPQAQAQGRGFAGNKILNPKLSSTEHDGSHGVLERGGKSSAASWRPDQTHAHTFTRHTLAPNGAEPKMLEPRSS